MTLLEGLLVLARDTVRSPRDGARKVLQMGLPVSARWDALALTAVVSALLTQVAIALTPGDSPVLVPGPLAMAVMQGVIMVLTALAVHGIGRWRGGHGRLEDAVLLMAWLQFILLCLQVMQLVALLVLPLLSDVIGLFGLGLFLWLLTAFIAEIHGFQSLGAVFAAILGSMFVLALILSVLLSPFLQIPV